MSRCNSLRVPRSRDPLCGGERESLVCSTVRTDAQINHRPPPNLVDRPMPEGSGSRRPIQRGAGSGTKVEGSDDDDGGGGGGSGGGGGGGGPGGGRESHAQAARNSWTTLSRRQPVRRWMWPRRATSSSRSRGSARAAPTTARLRMAIETTARSSLLLLVEWWATMPHTWCAWFNCATRFPQLSRGLIGSACASRHMAVW